MQKCMVNIYGVQPEQYTEFNLNSFRGHLKCLSTYKHTFEYVCHVPTDNIRVWASSE